MRSLKKVYPINFVATNQKYHGIIVIQQVLCDNQCV